jgi:hypothetical protein
MVHRHRGLQVRINSWQLGLILIGLTLAGAIFIATDAFKGSQYRRTADAYLTGMRDGADVASLLGPGVGGFINVLSFRYLKEWPHRDSPNGYRAVFDRAHYEEAKQRNEYRTRSNSYEKWLALNRDALMSVAATGKANFTYESSADGFELIYPPEVSTQLLYDVEITNQVGMKLYKKATITVAKKDAGFVISSIDTE